MFTLDAFVLMILMVHPVVHLMPTFIASES